MKRLLLTFGIERPDFNGFVGKFIEMFSRFSLNFHAFLPLFLIVLTLFYGRIWSVSTVRLNKAFDIVRLL
jgi:hypothetical protein